MVLESELIDNILTKPTKLSDDQRKAVLSEARHNRIIAGAGAGKTETLTRRIAYLLLVKKVRPASIVAFTFTEKAAQSMKSRIYQRIQELAGANATANLGEMYVGTIHGFAKRILEDHFRFGNHNVLDEGKQVAFLMRHGWDLGINDYASSYAQACQVFLRTVDMVWDEMLDEDELRERAPHFHNPLKRYEEMLRKHKQLTYSRMIHEAVLNLRRAPEKLSHIKHLIVDEYQDINQAQAELIKLLGRNGNVFVVGDPRQSIYQWRGSDERFFDTFSKDFAGTNTIVIHENRRSTTKIVKNANRFSETFERVHYEHMQPTRDETGLVGVVSNETPQDEAEWIADRVGELLSKNKMKYSDIGVLTRSVSTSAGPLIDALKKRDIPYIVGGKIGLFKRGEARAVGMIFAWFWEQGFWTENPWRPHERTMGDSLMRMAIVNWDHAHRHGHPEDAVEKLTQIKRDLISAKPSYDNFTKIYYDVLAALGYEELDYTDPRDAAVMANLGRFNNLLTDYESANRIGGRRPNWVEDLKGLCWFMNSYAIQSYEEQPSDDIRGVDAVQVMTIHQAKGLEWPVVFLFATVKGRFPSRYTGSAQNWCGVPTDMFDVQRYQGDIEDEKRLFYVAITRAKDILLISHFQRINKNVNRSIFLDYLDENVTTIFHDNDRLPPTRIHPNSKGDEIQTFAAGEIITYDICPHMYLLRDIWGYQPQFSPAIGYGNGLHYCLRRAGELIKNEGYSPVDAISKAVTEDFHMPFLGGEVLEIFRKSAGKRLSRFATKYGDDLKRIEEVEYRLEYPIQNATIMGKVDVILREGGIMEVRDYKTSEEARTFEEISVQIRLYAAGLKGLGRPVKSGSIAYLDEANIKMVDVADHLLDAEKRKAEKTVEAILKRQFEPNSGANCKRCDQRPICKWKSPDFAHTPVTKLSIESILA